MSCTAISLFENLMLLKLSLTDKTPFPTSNRDFVFLLLTLDLSLPSPFALPSASPPIPSDPSHPPSAHRKFQVISIPLAHPSAPERKGYVRGKYVAVEEVEETEGRAVVWKSVLLCLVSIWMLMASTEWRRRAARVAASPRPSRTSLCWSFLLAVGRKRLLIKVSSD